MRRLIYAVLFAFAAMTAAAAAPNESVPAAAPPACVETADPAQTTLQPRIELAQSGCRSDCSSRRGYCSSSCRDSQCRAICNDLYQRCVSSCR